MRLRLALVLVCGLVLFGCAAGPALADHTHRATTSTTSTTSSAATGTHAKDKKKHRAHHHAPVVTGATAAQGQAVIRDCTSHGQLTQQFTRPELKEALAIMSASTSQYTNCSTVIHNALAHGIKPVKGGGSSSSSTTTIVIIVVVVLVLLAAIFGGLALRRRRGGGGGGGDDAPLDA